MKHIRAIAVLEADLEVTPLGTRSRLTSELQGAAILRATVERVLRAKRFHCALVACPGTQRGRVQRMLHGTAARVVAVEADPPPWRGLVQSARKWSLDGWRGGLGGSTVFDEYTDCRVLAGLLQQQPCDAVLSVPPAAPFFDPAIADAMVALMETDEQETRLVFTQVPPGIAGILLQAGLVQEMAEKRIPIGWLFSYKPDAPRKDLIFDSCCLSSPVELRHASGRLIVDTQRAYETAAALSQELPDADSPAVGRWLQRREATFVPPIPREVEIELTTDDPYPQTVLRPRGARLERRGPIDPQVVAAIAAELSAVDDSLVVLAGFGDPLSHPALGEVLAALRSTDGTRPGVYGVALRTHGVGLTDEAVDLLIDHAVDVVEVMLDAWTPELYAQLHSRGTNAADLPSVLANIERLERARAERKAVRPVVVPSMTKCRDNLHELDDFYDGWLRQLGTVCVHGFNHHAGRIENRSVIDMTPAARFACRRLRTRCVVLADGRMTMCAMDVAGRFSLGRLEGASTVARRWQADPLAKLREDHAAGKFDANPLCAACDEWHRP